MSLPLFIKALQSAIIAVAIFVLISWIIKLEVSFDTDLAQTLLVFAIIWTLIEYNQLRRRSAQLTI